jgi:site-specific recombinase XerD
MRQAGHDRHGHRLTGLIVALRRTGLRIHEALSLTETDLDQRRGSILVRHGKNDRRREVGMDVWAWSDSTAGVELRHLALKAGLRRRSAPHPLRHAHAALP